MMMYKTYFITLFRFFSTLSVSLYFVTNKLYNPTTNNFTGKFTLNAFKFIPTYLISVIGRYYHYS